MFTRSRRVGKKKGYKDPTFSQIFNTRLDSQTGETEVLQNPTQIVEIIIYQLSNMRFPEEKKISSTKSIRLLGRQNHPRFKKTVLSGLSFMDRPRVSCLCDRKGSTCPKPKKKEGDLSKTKICNTFFQWMVFFSVYQKLFWKFSSKARKHVGIMTTPLLVTSNCCRISASKQKNRRWRSCMDMVG